MANANSFSSALRASREGNDASLRALERVGSGDGAPTAAPAMQPRLASGVYRFVDEYAGLDRLDRAELDETDED